MPVLSDFTVITRNDFLYNGAVLNKTFNTGGRYDSQALLDIAALGGYYGDDPSMRIRVRINGRLLSTSSIHRWRDHSYIVHDRISIVVPSGVLNSGSNTFRIEPVYESSSDYAFIGPVVCHFHQRS